MKTSWILCGLFFCTSLLGQAVPRTEKIYSAEELRADFKVMRTQLESINTGLYRYSTESDLDGAFDSLFMNITHPMTELEFVKTMLSLSGYIRNGHTGFYYSEATEKEIKEKGLFMPLDVHWVDNRLFILKNMSENKALKVGSEIVSINGKTPAEIKEELLFYLPRDGNAGYQTAARFQRIWWYLPLLHSFKEKYYIKIKSDNKENNSLIINALPLGKIKKTRTERYQKTSVNSKPLIDLKLLEDQKTAILTVQTFDIETLRKNKSPYKKSFRNAFESIEEKEIQHLILDLRDNGGGDDAATRLLTAYLYDQPFHYYSDVFVNTRKIEKKAGYQDMVWHYNLYLKYKTKRQKEADKYAFKTPEKRRDFQPKKSAFKGDLYVLMNGNSFSASGEVISFLKHHQAAAFIGEEAGGNRQSNTSGITLTLELPNTQARVFVPVIQYVMEQTEAPNDHGVFPDFPIQVSIKDKIEGRDVELEKALELINEGQ